RDFPEVAQAFEVHAVLAGYSGSLKEKERQQRLQEESARQTLIELRVLAQHEVRNERIPELINRLAIQLERQMRMVLHDQLDRRDDLEAAAAPRVAIEALKEGRPDGLLEIGLTQEGASDRLQLAVHNRSDRLTAHGIRLELADLTPQFKLYFPAGLKFHQIAPLGEVTRAARFEIFADWSAAAEDEQQIDILKSFGAADDGAAMLAQTEIVKLRNFYNNQFSEDEIDQLNQDLEVKLEGLGRGAIKSDRVMNLLETAQRRGQWRELLAASAQINPYTPQLPGVAKIEHDGERYDVTVRYWYYLDGVEAQQKGTAKFSVVRQFEVKEGQADA
ncbi:MAG: hypothetical protein AAF633_14890, partial [Chloroflexota bacterium]